MHTYIHAYTPGHLVEMAQAAKTRVELSLDAVPTLAGALELVEQGIFSSLQPANIRLKRALGMLFVCIYVYKESQCI